MGQPLGRYPAATFKSVVYWCADEIGEEAAELDFESLGGHDVDTKEGIIRAIRSLRVEAERCKHASDVLAIRCFERFYEEWR